MQTMPRAFIQAARQARHASTAAHQVQQAGIIGSGQMGLGIALVAARYAKVPVLLSDSSESALSKGLAFLDTLLEKDVKKGKLSNEDASATRQRVKTVSKLEDLAECDLIIEAVKESLPVKQSIFSQLAQITKSDCILGSNTSSISLTKIAASAVPKGEDAATSSSPKRVMGIHFFNPVPVMKLVELIRPLQASDQTVERAQAFAVACGKTPVTSQDTPGFVSNRVLMPFINEAIICLETGVASKEDIDTTLKLGMAHPMGPLQLADFIGLDTCYSIMQVLYAETADSKYRPSVLLGRYVDAGWLGKKSGKGFYEYSS